MAVRGGYGRFFVVTGVDLQGFAVISRLCGDGVCEAFKGRFGG